MRISAAVGITKEEAKRKVRSILMHQQQVLIEKAINGMDNDELASYLHSDYYFYHIEEENNEED